MSRVRLPRAFCTTLAFRAREKSLATRSTKGAYFCTACSDSTSGFSRSRSKRHWGPFLSSRERGIRASRVSSRPRPCTPPPFPQREAGEAGSRLLVPRGQAARVWASAAALPQGSPVRFAQGRRGPLPEPAAGVCANWQAPRLAHPSPPRALSGAEAFAVRKGAEPPGRPGPAVLSSHPRVGEAPGDLHLPAPAMLPLCQPHRPLPAEPPAAVWQESSRVSPNTPTQSPAPTGRCLQGLQGGPDLDEGRSPTHTQAPQRPVQVRTP